MNNASFRPVYYRDSMSKVTKLINELEQVGHIAEVNNEVLPTTSTVVVKFADGRVTRIVYKETIADRLLGRTVA